MNAVIGNPLLLQIKKDGEIVFIYIHKEKSIRQNGNEVKIEEPDIDLVINDIDAKTIARALSETHESFVMNINMMHYSRD